MNQPFHFRWRFVCPGYRRLLAFSVVGSAAAFVLIAGIVAQAVDSPIDRAWSTLQMGATDKDKDQRAAAVRVLGLIENNAKAAEMATNALKDDSPDVRAAGAEALGKMKAKSSIPKLQDLAQNDKEPAVVLASGRSLVALGDPSGYGVYYAILTGEQKTGQGLMDEQKKMLHDPKKMAQFGFEQGIGFIPFAGMGYTAIKTLTKDDISPVRAAAAKILADDKDPKSGKALVTAASDKSWVVRVAALDAISHRNDPLLSPQIETCLADDKDIVRYTAAAAIVHLNDVRQRRSSQKSEHRAGIPAKE
jgi:hypothetical protein